MIKGRGVLALLFFIFLLLPPAPRPAEGQVVSGAIALARVLVWGSKIIRISLPFTVTRLRSIYQAWKAAGKPVFSRLKIPLSTAVLYIGGSYLLSEFQRIASLESSSSTYIVDTTGTVTGVCLVSLSGNLVNLTRTATGCGTSYNATQVSISTGGISFNTSAIQRCQGDSWQEYRNVHLTLGVCQNGSLSQYSAYTGSATAQLYQSLSSLPSCSGSCAPLPGNFNLDTERSKVLPNLLDVPMEAYPTANDPGYTDAFPIPTESGDSVTIEDTSTGTTTSETTGNQGSTNQNTGQMAIPGDNTYDPTLDNIPNKLPIPDLINNFISASPLMRWVQGAHISASAGSCSVSGSFLNKSFTLDFCPLAPYLNQIGAFVLAFAHLYALYIVFRVN